MEPFRPWGQVDWLLGRLNGRNWSLIGCCGTEKRSIALAEHLGRGRFELALMIEIVDPEPLDEQALRSRLNERRNQLGSLGFGAEEIVTHGLLADIDEIADTVLRIADGGATSLLIDVTSLPKYWFFPMIQAALADDRFKDIIVAYTSGVGYADQLSENISPLRVLPGFNAGHRAVQRS